MRGPPPPKLGVFSQELKCLCIVFPIGKSIHSMVAHLDAVTSLAVDPNGLYLMSGSKCEKCYGAVFILMLV